MIDLEKFLDPSANNNYKSKPFRKGTWVYATDGNVLIRVKGLKGEFEKTELALFEKVINPIVNVKQWVKMPKIKRCKSCSEMMNKSSKACTHNPVKIGERFILHAYAELISTLPKVLIGHTSSEYDPVFFKFTGGQGAVMSISKNL